MPVETHRGSGSEVKRFQAPLSGGALSFSAVRMQCREDPPSGAQPQPTAQHPRALPPWQGRSHSLPLSLSPLSNWEFNNTILTGVFRLHH